MLRFRVFRNGAAPAEVDLSTAYLVGSDSVPVRGEFSYANGEIVCRKRAAGPAALTIMWESKNFGSVMLETTRLPEREEPYILNLELARGRVMRLMQKREEWGIFDLADVAAVNEKAMEARDLLLEGITNQADPARASEYADRCLELVLPVSEQAATPPNTISAGAEDESEMGAFARERNPVKERGLLIKFQEFMPAGLVPVVIHVT